MGLKAFQWLERLAFKYLEVITVITEQATKDRATIYFGSCPSVSSTNSGLDDAASASNSFDLLALSVDSQIDQENQKYGFFSLIANSLTH